MQDPGLPSSDISNPKLLKKKISTSKHSSFQLQGDGVQQIQNPQSTLSGRAGRKSSKRNLKNEVSPLFQLPEGSNSDSLQESSISGNEYRKLRREYLLLEEESFALDRELRDVEDDVKTLEEEKHVLLDQLVVLEGLIDPAEV